jgi:hypothetical protein
MPRFYHGTREKDLFSTHFKTSIFLSRGKGEKRLKKIALLISGLDMVFDQPKSFLL